MRTGSRAAAIPVFISSASTPSSIAIAASEAVPTPASTITGTFARSLMSRIATVTTSAPRSSWACCMISSDGYFPVPTNSRERNSYFPILSVSILVSVCMLTPCDRDDDLEPVAVAQRGQAVLRARNDIVVQRDGAAVALNDDVVPRAQHGLTALRDGDRLEIIVAVAGG